MPAGLYRIKAMCCSTAAGFLSTTSAKRPSGWLWIPMVQRILAFVGWKIYESEIIDQLKACLN